MPNQNYAPLPLRPLILPESLRLTEKQEAELKQIRDEARIRHEKARKAALKQGREYFPLLPVECSWTYEEAFRRRTHNERNHP